MLISLPNAISTGVPADQQRLICGGIPVNTGSLAELNIKEESLLHMGLRLPITDMMYNMFRPYFKRRLVM